MILCISILSGVGIYGIYSASKTDKDISRKRKMLSTFDGTYYNETNDKRKKNYIFLVIPICINFCLLSRHIEIWKLEI